MDTLSVAPDMFGGAPATFTATKRLGSDASRISQIQDGKWKAISEYFSSPAPAK
jgi:branched-chain amino acid transport system substrate-binding protein